MHHGEQLGHVKWNETTRYRFVEFSKTGREIHVISKEKAPWAFKYCRASGSVGVVQSRDMNVTSATKGLPVTWRADNGCWRLCTGPGVALDTSFSCSFLQCNAVEAYSYSRYSNFERDLRQAQCRCLFLAT